MMVSGEIAVGKAQVRRTHVERKLSGDWASGSEPMQLTIRIAGRSSLLLFLVVGGGIVVVGGIVVAIGDIVVISVFKIGVEEVVSQL